MSAFAAQAFYLFSGLAVLATALVIVQRNAVHALLWLIVAFLATAGVLYTLGAPFVAVLEVIIYAGAIMVLFVFVVMMLNPQAELEPAGSRWPRLLSACGPVLLALGIVGALAWILTGIAGGTLHSADIGPRQVAHALFGTYVLGVELASMLLLAGLVGAFHLGRRMLWSLRERGPR
jgi:NADH-quinone oxidoreductase subunit J